MFTLQELQAARDSFPVKRVDCPHCGEWLRLGPVAVVFATRSCAACGQRVVAESEGEATSPFSREQLDEACAAYARASTRALWVIAAGALWFLAVTVAIALYRDTIRAAIDPFIRPDLFLPPVLFGPGLASIGAAVWILERERSRGLKCPHCAATCAAVPRGVPNLTQLTGNCAKCGRKLLDEAPPEEPVGPLSTVDDFKAAERRAMRGDWVGLLLVALALVIPFGGILVVNPERLFIVTEKRYDAVTAAVVASAVISGWVLGTSAVGLLGLRWLSRRHMRKRAAEPALNCPHCKASLLATSVVVASKRCPSCRNRVLAEPEAQTVASGG